MEVSIKNLKDFVVRACVAVGVPEEDGKILADSYLSADMRNVRSHGTVYFPDYFKNLKLGLFNTNPEIKITSRFPTSITVDGDNGLGSVVMVKSLNRLLEIADIYGIATAGIRNINHIGACAYYAKLAAEKGFCTIVLTGSKAFVAPYGSAEPYFGTNPICVGIPRDNAPPIIADLATSSGARGKVKVYLRKGQQLPEGWALNKDGQPTTDPQEALEGVLLAAAGHKGSALAAMVSYASGVMNGAGFGHEVEVFTNYERDEPTGTGAFIIAVRRDIFLDNETVGERTERFVSEIKALKPVPGTEEVMLPGERSARSEAVSAKKGTVDVDEKLIADYAEIARQLGIEPMSTD